MSRDPRVAPAATTILVALGAAVVGGVLAGSPAPVVVRDVVLVVLVLAVAGVLGAVLAALVEPDPSCRDRVLVVAACAAGVWTAAAAVTAFLLYLAQAPALDSPAFGPGLVAFLADVAIGRTWAAAAMIAAVLTALLVAVRSRRGVTFLGFVTVVAAVPVALQSATAADAFGPARTLITAGLVQLVATAAWIGVLVLRPHPRFALTGPSAAKRTVRTAPSAAESPVSGGGSAVGALVVAAGAALPARLADAAATPLAVAGACALGLAGVVAVVGFRARLRFVQLVLLGVGVGLGAAASGASVEPDVTARTSPAAILTGAPLPAPPSVGALLTAWQPDAVWLVVAVALLIAYVGAAVRAERSWPAVRSASWVGGLVLLVWLTSGGPARYRLVLVVPELAQQAALLLVVPLLLAGGAPVRLARAAAPGRDLRLPAVGPLRAAVVAVAAVALLDGTGLLRWAVTDVVGAEVATAVLLLVGVLLVHASIAAPRRAGAAAALVLLLVETGAAVLLGSSGSLLLADWYGAMGWGTDALAAQRSGALVVWLVAAVPTAALLGRALLGTTRGTPTTPTRQRATEASRAEATA